MSNLHNHYSGLASVLANPEAVANPKALSAGDSLMQSHVQAAHFGLGQVLSAVAVLIQTQAQLDPAHQMPPARIKRRHGRASAVGWRGDDDAERHWSSL